MKLTILALSCLFLVAHAEINKSVSITEDTNTIHTSVSIDENSSFSGNYGIIINNENQDINLSNMHIKSHTIVKGNGILIGNTGIIINSR